MMKVQVQFLALLLAIVVGMGFIACGNNGQEIETGAGHKRIYSCPMHPQIMRDKPGLCPICGMTLAEKSEHGGSHNVDGLPLLIKPTNTFVLSTVKITHPKQMDMPMKLHTTGTVGYDLKQTNTVAARVTGRIDKLYVRYRYQPIAKGQKLADIYSKELLTEQENFIYLLENDPENRSIVAAAEKRLLLQGLAHDQVESLKKSRKPLLNIPIYSPYSGHLHELANGAQSSSENMTSMNAAEPQALTVREGMYFQKGQTIFNIYDTQKVWVLLNIYPADAGKISVGQKIALEFDGIEAPPLEANIDFIEPVLREGNSTITARVYLDNPGRQIKIGTLVRATIEASIEQGLFVPSTALINLGVQDVVMVKENAIFKAKRVQRGIETDGWIKILVGLTEADEIAENAQLLMDSESFIKLEGGKNE